MVSPGTQSRPRTNSDWKANSRCVSHLAMQLVEKSPKDEIRKSEGKVSRGRRPLATIKILTDALQRRVPEDVED